MGDRGYASVFALGMLLGGVLLMGLTADITRLIVTWRQTSHLAHTAAETAAGWVEPMPLYRGELLLDEAAAELAARGVAADPSRTVMVSTSPHEVCVTVSEQVRVGIMRLVGGSAQSTTVTACASPRQG